MQKQNNLTNNVVIQGYLSTPVKLMLEKEKNTYKASFRISNPCQMGRNTYSNDFWVVIYGKKAQVCKDELSQGDKCTVIGKISLWYKAGNNGVERTGATINATDISFD